MFSILLLVTGYSNEKTLNVFYEFVFEFQIQLYFAHACSMFDYHLSVDDTIRRNQDQYVSIFSKMLKDRNLLEKVERSFSSSETPWLFLARAASALTNKGKELVDFFLVDLDVSLQYTLPTVEILSVKNARAWVSMDFK